MISQSSSITSQLTGLSKNLGQSVKSSLNKLSTENLKSVLSNDLTRTGQDLISSTKSNLDVSQLQGSITNVTNQLKDSIQGGINNISGSISNLLPFSLIFDNFEPFSNLNLSELSGLIKIPSVSVPKLNTNFNFEKKLEVPNELVTKINNNKILNQEVDIQKSKNKKSNQINYKYIYTYQSLVKKLIEAKRLDDIGDSKKATSLLEDALKIDPNNSVVKDLLNKSKKKSDTNIQPVFKFLLNIVTSPLKVIFGIISYIMDLFKSFLNPFELPGKIIDFVSFKWILDFFNPTSKNSLFQMIGLKFDIETFLTDYVPGLISGTKQNFDMSKIIDMPFFVQKLPTYDLKQFDFFHNSRNGTPTITFPSLNVFPKLPSIPTSLLSNVLCFIESIINSFIDFIWSLLGLGSIIPAPHLKLCRDSNQNVSPNDVLDLLNGKFKDPSKSTSVNAEDEPTYNFVFNIKTSDGRDLRELNQDELNKWIEENKDIKFDFNL